MTSKERIMRALRLENPDRLPATLHQWQQYHLDVYMGGVDMIGGMDQLNILTSGGKEIIRREVRRLFEGFGINDGYIMSASDHFFDSPVENLNSSPKWRRIAPINNFF